MSDANKSTPAKSCPWEDGRLGASEEHAVRASAGHEQRVDEAVGLQLISIRLPRALIDNLKFIAAREGLGYQPLARRVLQRFADAELKAIARDELLLNAKCPSMDGGAVEDSDGDEGTTPERRRA